MQGEQADGVGLWLWFALGAAVLLSACLAALLVRGRRRLDDLTRQVKVQTARTRAAEMSREDLEIRMLHLERLDTVGLLASGVAHDINNILCSVQGHAELLGEPSAPQQIDAANVIVLGTRKAAELCNKLLDYASPSIWRPKPADLRELVDDIQPLLASVSGEVALHKESVSEPVVANVDRAGLEQVLVNLVTNARDTETQAHRITIRTYNVDHPAAGEGTWFGQVDAAGGTAVLEVEDDGIGMDPLHLARIFDPFFTTRVHGRGLGLAAALDVVGKLGGAFQVHTQRGAGARFSIHLPRVPTAVGDGASSGPGTILVIDDEDLVLAWVRRVLENAGWEVLSAESGREGLEMYRQHRHRLDAALIDVNLPDMDGHALLGDIRQSDPELAVVLMSGRGEIGLRESEGGQLRQRVLQKPFTAKELYGALDVTRSRMSD